jgi:hypothetical protein
MKEYERKYERKENGSSLHSLLPYMGRRQVCDHISSLSQCPRYAKTLEQCHQMKSAIILFSKIDIIFVRRCFGIAAELNRLRKGSAVISSDETAPSTTN